MPKIVAYEFGGFRLDIETRELSRPNNEPVFLPKKPFELLKYLIIKKNRVVPKEQIVNRIWGDGNSIGDGSYNQLVTTLRKDYLKNDEVIETIPSVGLRFKFEVNEITEEDISESSDKEPPKLPAEPLTFKEWRDKYGIKWQFLTFVLATIAVSFIVFFKSGDIKNTWVVGSISHIILIIVSLIYYRYSSPRFKKFPLITKHIQNDNLRPDIKEATKCKDESDWEITKKNAEDGFSYFRKSWLILLGVWVVLYSIVILILLYGSAEVKDLLQLNNKNTLSFLMTFFNNLNTILLIVCFYIFDALEKGVKDIKESDFWVAVSAILVALSAIEIFSLNIVEIENRDTVSWVFRVLSGVIGAIALGLFVGRLQSKFFNPKIWFNAALYFYISLQPLFVFFDDETPKIQVVTAIVIHMALILKCLLFLYLFWAFETGRFLFYLVRVRQINEEIETDWKKFQIVFENSNINTSSTPT